MKSERQQQETAYERLLRGIETMRCDHRAILQEMKADREATHAFIVRSMIVGGGVLAVLLIIIVTAGS